MAILRQGLQTTGALDCSARSVLPREGGRLTSMAAPHGGRRIRAGDILGLKVDIDPPAEALSVSDTKQEEHDSSLDDRKTNTSTATRAADDKGKDARPTKADGDGGEEDDAKRDEDIVLRELAMLSGSAIVGRSATDLLLRTRYRPNLMAASRKGCLPKARLRTLKLKSGDLLLIMGPSEVMAALINETGCVPLGERELRIPDKCMAMMAGAIMLGSAGKPGQVTGAVAGCHEPLSDMSRFWPAHSSGLQIAMPSAGCGKPACG